MYVFNLAVTDLMVGMAMVLKVAETYQPATFHSQYICISMRIGTIVHSMMLSVFVMAGESPLLLYAGAHSGAY